MHHPYEAIIASEVPEATIASMADMSDADIQSHIDRIKGMQSSLAYRMNTRNAVQRIDATELHAYGCELIRRRVMADRFAIAEADAYAALASLDNTLADLAQPIMQAAE